LALQFWYILEKCIKNLEEVFVSRIQESINQFFEIHTKSFLLQFEEVYKRLFACLLHQTAYPQEFDYLTGWNGKQFEIRSQSFLLFGTFSMIPSIQFLRWNVPR
jgi:HD superfamily phosphohydrolase